MKFSYSWIEEMVDGLKMDAAELGKQITIKTAECEGIHAVGEAFAKAVLAKVASVEPIEGSKAKRTIVKSAAYGERIVVCGAPNVRAGMTSVYVPTGTVVNGKKIEKAVVHGVESDGMLCSGLELGINHDHEGILDLEGGIGCQPDWIIEIDNKSLTHRPDLWGHFGMAREVAAIYGLPLRDPVRPTLIPAEGHPVKVVIEDYDLCPHYAALVVDKIEVKPSPPFFQYRLNSVDLNPISNIVDVTNWVMAELAQPMHAFDADKLHGDTIYIRPARQGESLAALNDETYQLDPSNLVIADAQGPIAIAGVIGGRASAISASTRRIVFESATFHPTSVRRTSAKLRLRTDASMRFEKSQDPENPLRGLLRAVDLLRRLSPGFEIVDGWVAARKPVAPPIVIPLPVEWLQRKLGHFVSAEEAAEILRRLQFKVDIVDSGLLNVTVPSWRATKDVTLKDDLVEEIGRMIGYGNITPQAPLVAAVPPVVNETREFFHELRDHVAAQGFHEVYNYSFLSEEQVRAFGLDPADHIKVLNPISSEQGLLRRSLLPGILKNLFDNSRFFDRFRLFEIGYEIRRSGKEPNEIPHLVAAVYAKDEGVAGLDELRRLALCLHRGITFRPVQTAASHEHPGRVAELLLEGAPAGRLFEFHPNMLKGRGAVLDIDLSRFRWETKRYQPARKFPSSDFDLSIVVPNRTLVGDLDSLLRNAAGDALASCEYRLTYPLADHTKSVTFRLTVAAPDRTLTSEEIASIRARVIEAVEAAGHTLRG